MVWCGLKKADSLHQFDIPLVETVVNELYAECTCDIITRQTRQLIELSIYVQLNTISLILETLCPANLLASNSTETRPNMI